jgi:predicted HAD superfamily hydrolase
MTINKNAFYSWIMKDWKALGTNEEERLHGLYLELSVDIDPTVMLYHLIGVYLLPYSAMKFLINETYIMDLIIYLCIKDRYAAIFKHVAGR